MLEQNKPTFDFCNIPLWWEMGYTGKGIRIGNIDGAVMESVPFLEGKVHNGAGMKADRGDMDSHCQHTSFVLHQVAPDAEIFALPSCYPEVPSVVDSLNWAIKNDIHIISMSMLLNHTEQEIIAAQKAAYEAGILLLCSAANEGEKPDGSNTLSLTSKLRFWLSVGAAELRQNRTVRRAHYSSVGNQLDIMGFSDIWVKSARDEELEFPMEGTSFSSPLVAGMLALYYQWHMEKTGHKPLPAQVRQFVLANCAYHGMPTQPEYTGRGLFTLPETLPRLPSDEPVLVLKVGSKTAYNHDREISLAAAPFIKNGRTMVPLRVISEALGCRVEWDEKTKTIRIFQ